MAAKAVTAVNVKSNTVKTAKNFFMRIASLNNNSVEIFFVEVHYSYFLFFVNFAANDFTTENRRADFFFTL